MLTSESKVTIGITAFNERELLLEAWNSVIKQTSDKWDAELGKWITVESGKWVIEPGQTRWMALYKLKRPTQRVLVKIREEDEPYFHMISDSEHREIKTIEEAAPLFKDKNNLPGKGYGYLKRKKKEWFS